MRAGLSLSLIGCILSAATNVAVGLEIKLTARESAQAARSPGAITTGVPLARGAVKDVAKLRVSLTGKPIPAQFTKTAVWDDGSVRWALMDVQADVPAGGAVELVVSDSGGNPAPAAPAKAEETADTVKLSSGPMQLTISRKKPGLFESLKVDGKELLASGGRGLVVVKEDGGEVVAGPATEVKIEQSGPMRAVVCLRGKFPGVHADKLAYTVRVSVFAGQKRAQVHVWLENQGAFGWYTPRSDAEYWSGASKTCDWFKFGGMNVELGLGLGGEVSAACESAKGAGSFKVLQTCRMTRTPPPAKNQIAPPPYYTWNDFEYTIKSGEQELAKGDRTDGVVSLSGSAGAMTAAVRDFWQNYDKAIELSGNTLKLWLWPTEGQWPRAQRQPSRPGPEDPLGKSGLSIGGRGYYLPGGTHKGHEFVLDFSGRDAKAVGAELSDPLWALASAEDYAASEAAPGVLAPPQARTGLKSCDSKLDAWTRMARAIIDPENASGFIKTSQELPAKRAAEFQAEDAYWFGWMDFGDIPVPGHGSVSLHYDWTWIVLAGALRTGDAGFLRLANGMARHRIDVDQLWSDQDPPECRGLQRPDSNQPAIHFSGRFSRRPTLETNWLAGVVLYYMLTGEPKALECARRNADGIAAAWAGPKAPRGDMAATAWSVSSYLAMHDLTGEKKWLDDALALFRSNVMPIWKEQGPFLHDPDHQIRGQTYMKEDEKYCYAIATLCDLHRHTGDKDVLKLLTEGTEQEFPGSFFAAPKFLADLNAYVGLVTSNKELLAKAAELFAQGFPESKNPPVILPGSSTWSRAAAMTLRSGHTLQYAHWKSARAAGGKN